MKTITKLRINKVEKLVLGALEKATEEIPDITCEELGSAMLKIIVGMNNEELNKL